MLACAKHNAAVYGVSNKIWWIQGDCFDVLKKRLKAVAKEAVIFASPPWGGEQQPYHVLTFFCHEAEMHEPNTC